MLGGAESTGIVVELWFTALQHILVKWSAFSSSNYTVSSSVNVSVKVYYTTEKKHLVFQMSFSCDKIIPVSAPLELLLV